MKTGELYVEQIVVGSLVLATAALPWLPEIVSRVPGGIGLSIVTASIAVGIAFLIGVPFDRFADTLSERLDTHNRLRFALKKAKGQTLDPDDAAAGSRDYFPEDRLRLGGLLEPAPVVAWIDYHRSRIRLTRALWVYGPGCALAATVGLTRLLEYEQSITPGGWVAMIVLAYAAWAFPFRKKLARTDDRAAFAEYAESGRWLDLGEVKDWKSARSAVGVWFSEWPAWAIPLAHFVAAFVTALEPACRGDIAPMAAAAGGAVTVVVSAWAWWRISETFRSYLFDVDRYGAPSG